MNGIGNAWKIMGGLLALLLLLAAATVAAYGWYVTSAWNENRTLVTDPSIDEALASEPTSPGHGHQAVPNAPLNILILGSDSRLVNVDYTSALGFRTDTIMVLHIPSDRQGFQVISIPRDSWVEIEGHGRAKINAAAAYGGLPLSIETISDFIDAGIDHVAIIDFAGLEGLTDAVGGVDVYSDIAFTNGSSTFDVGVNHLDGGAALDFVRARKQFADGDLQRVRNQQEFLAELSSKLMTGDLLHQPAKLARSITNFSQYVTTDKGLDSGLIIDVARDFSGGSSAAVDYATAPISGVGETEDGQQYLVVDGEGLADLRQAFAEDLLADYIEEAEDQQL